MGHSLGGLLFSVALAAGQVPQQDGTASVAGRIRDDKGRPVAGAVVQAIGGRLMTRSDSQGRFDLRGLPAGLNRLRVLALAFDPVDTTLSLRRAERRGWNVVVRVAEWVARAAQADSARVAAGGVDSIAFGLVSTDTSSAFSYERFGLDLLRAAIETSSPESSRVVSPLSAGQALALALAAAKDSTAIFIARTLRLGALGPEGVAARSRRFNEALRTRRDVTLKIANALWVDTSATLQSALEGWAHQWYGAAVRRLPLRVPEVVPVLNRWADSVTNGVIPAIRKDPFARRRPLRPSDSR